MAPKSPTLPTLLALFVLTKVGSGQEPDVQPPTRNANYQQHEFTGKEGATLHYWLMSPAKVEADRRYPLVLALHGRGGNTQAASVLGSEKMRRDYPCYVLAPVATRAGLWAVPGDFDRLVIILGRCARQ